MCIEFVTVCCYLRDKRLKLVPTARSAHEKSKCDPSFRAAVSCPSPATESNSSTCEFAGLPAMRANSYLTSLENMENTAYVLTDLHQCWKTAPISAYVRNCSYRSLTQRAAMTDAHGQNAPRAAPRTEPNDCGNSSIPTVPRNSF